MQIWLTTVSLFLALLSPLAAQDDADLVKAFKRSFKPSAKALEKAMQGADGYRTDHPVYRQKRAAADKLASDWRKAIESLRGSGSAATAKAVADAWVKVDKEVGPLWKERGKLEKRVEKSYSKIEKLTGGEGVQPDNEYPQSVRAAEVVFLQASRRSSEVRRRITLLTAMHEELRLVVKSMVDPAGIGWLLDNLIGSKKHALALKVAAIRAAASRGEQLYGAMTSALDRAQKPDEIAGLVHGIGMLRERAKSSAPKLLALLDHADPGVCEQAALALQHMKIPASIEPMIGLLSRSRGHARQRIANALEILTSQQFGKDVAAWRRWFAAEGADYAAGLKPLGEGKASAHEEYNKKNYYYGIPQDGGAILYIIDCSGSMVVDKDSPEWEGGQGNPRPIAARDKKNSRSAASKRELIRAIGQLSSAKTFNIIWYNHKAEAFKKKMTPATPENIKAAENWIKELPAYSSTNIYDAVKLAFTMTGRGSFDSSYSVEFDQVFLMTDGKPTLQGVGDDDPMKIIEGARGWNSLKRVQIHTIAFGTKDINHEFMRDLAVENGGSYRIVTPEGVKTYEEMKGKLDK